MTLFLKQAVNEFQPDFFMWLGDNPGHRVWNQSAVDHLRSIADISKQLQTEGDEKYGKIGSVYPILGNHEGLPCDIFDFEGKDHRWVIDQTANAWKPWLTEKAFKEYFATGSYSQLHPGTKLRIIGVNDLAYDSLNSYLWKNSTDPWGIVTASSSSN